MLSYPILYRFSLSKTSIKTSQSILFNFSRILIFNSYGRFPPLISLEVNILFLKFRRVFLIILSSFFESSILMATMIKYFELPFLVPKSPLSSNKYKTYYNRFTINFTTFSILFFIIDKFIPGLN